MRQLTLRGFDPELGQFIEEEARRTGRSRNKVVLALLRQATGLDRSPNVIGDRLDDLAGDWTEADAREFEEATRSCDQIDEELWR